MAIHNEGYYTPNPGEERRAMANGNSRDYLPKQAQEGLDKLGEKIGYNEWEEIEKEYSKYVHRQIGKDEVYKPQFEWFKDNFYPPKPKTNERPNT